MSDSFDASLVWTEPLDASLLHKQRGEVESWAKMPSALANAKLHAEREYQALRAACNRAVWGYGPHGERAPTADEIAELMNFLKPEDRDKLLRNARQAAEQRQLLALVALAEHALQDRIRAEQDHRAREEAERRDRAEFEAYDAAGKEARYEAWRAQRRAQG